MKGKKVYFLFFLKSLPSTLQYIIFALITSATGMEMIALISTYTLLLSIMSQHHPQYF